MNNKVLISLAHITFWCIYLAISTWVFSHFMPVTSSLLRGIANGIPLVALTYLNIWSINHFFEKNKFLTTISIAIALIIVFTPLRLMINDVFPNVNLADQLMGSYDSNRIGIIFTNILFILLSSFYQILRNRVQREKAYIKELQVHQEAQLNYLKAQINPHFLFNTLNNIYSLAITKSDKTAEMVMRLSHLLRYVIYESQDKMVSLSKEITNIEEYLALFRMRSMPEPNLAFEVTGGASTVSVAPMIIIPLVENCCKHCDFDTNPEAYTNITLEIRNKTIIFESKNSYNKKSKPAPVGGIGLNNIKQRLEMVYPSSHSLEINQSDTSYFVKLIIESHE